MFDGSKFIVYRHIVDRFNLFKKKTSELDARDDLKLVFCSSGVGTADEDRKVERDYLHNDQVCKK